MTSGWRRRGRPRSSSGVVGPTKKGGIIMRTREHTRFAVCLFVAILAGTVTADAGVQGAEAKSKYEIDMEAFIQEVDRSYPFFDLKGIRSDWENARVQLLQKAKTCRSDQEFLGLVLTACKSLRDSHLGPRNFKVDSPPQTPKYYPGISFLPATNGRVVVMYPRGGMDPKIKAGTIVTKIDGKDARGVLEGRSQAAWKEGGSFSSPQRARLYEFRIPLRGEVKGQTHKITCILDGEEQEFEISADIEASGWPHTYNLPQDLKGVGSSAFHTQLPSGVGYIYLRRVDESAEPCITQAIAAHPNVKGWIVDLRGNGGGGYGASLQQELQMLRKPVACLIDAGCMSAGETLARDLVNMTQARLFGSKTAGASSAKRIWNFPSGIGSMSLPTRSRWGIGGELIEYNGIAPHVEVEAVPEELQQGLNSAIVRAEEYITSKPSESIDPAGSGQHIPQDIPDDQRALTGRFLRPVNTNDWRENGALWGIATPDDRLRISPLRQWSHTGIELQKGQYLVILAEGSVQGCQRPVGSWAYGPFGPAGGPATDDHPGSRVCALIGRIVGEETHEFIVGESYRCEVPTDGKLELGVSDVWHFDNSGEFVVLIEVDGKRMNFAERRVANINVVTKNLAPTMKSMSEAEVSELDGARRIASPRGAHRPMLVTLQQFRPPLEIRARARTDSTNIRLYYGSFGTGQLIFNWEVRPDELRLHDPATGAVSGIRGAGGIEKNVFHDIVWRIGLQRMQVLVDGEERYRGVGDYRTVVSPVGIGPAWGSRVDVESLVIAPLDPAVMDAPTQTATQEKASAPSDEPLPQAIDRDRFLGWYKLTGGDTIIPVFKVHGTYYSVSWPGAEVPLKECPEGLEWAPTPSSMEGTKIGFDEDSNSYYVAIMDSQASHFSDGKYGVGEKQALTRIDKPSGLLDATAQRPRSNDDFLGWYQFVWLPCLGYELRKDGERYIAIGQICPEPGLWKTEGEPRELTPLPDGLGFVIDKKLRVRLTYNEALKRFELTMRDDKRQPAVIRMPLARVSALASAEGDAVPLLTAKIGIPSWH
jgi:hypothetical protein